MMSWSNRAQPVSILALAVALLIPPVMLAQPGGKSASSTKSQQPRKAKSKVKGGSTQESDLRAEAGATSTSPLSFPFKRAWQYLTDSASALPPTVAGARIYLPLSGGRVLCLDRDTGTLLWSSDPGGVISAPIAFAGNSVFVATKRVADDGSEAGGSLRAVDSTTGLTVWVKDYQRPFTSAVVARVDRLYVGSADGAFYALSLETGDVMWKIETQDVVRGSALVTDRAVYFGGDDGALRAIDPKLGSLIWKFQTGGRITGQPSMDDRAVYFGAGDGYVYSIEPHTGNLRWRSRTGAAVEASPVIVGDRILVASFDNFIYALSRSTGDRLWKRRLENRLSSAPIVDGDASLVAPLRGDYVAVFLNSDGRRVNLYQLDKDFEIVADPVFSESTLVLATNKGLVVATASRTKDSPTNAVKK
jgi:outer membrane protein assembly factor BamB